MTLMQRLCVGVFLSAAPLALASPVVSSGDMTSGPALAKPGMVLLAKNEKSADSKDSKSNKKKGERAKFLQGEARSKKGSKTKIDFDEAAIDGNRRTPAGVAITKNDPNREYDLINLRLSWRPEMVQSAASLETGRGR